jgi:hypothetical protein
MKPVKKCIVFSFSRLTLDKRNSTEIKKPLYLILSIKKLRRLSFFRRSTWPWSKKPDIRSGRRNSPEVRLLMYLFDFFKGWGEANKFYFATTTEYTELQRLLSGVHSIVRVKLAQAGEGGGVHAHPLSLHLPSPVKLQCALQLSGQTH